MHISLSHGLIALQHYYSGGGGDGGLSVVWSLVTVGGAVVVLGEVFIIEVLFLQTRNMPYITSQFATSSCMLGLKQLTVHRT